MLVPSRPSFKALHTKKIFCGAVLFAAGSIMLGFQLEAQVPALKGGPMVDCSGLPCVDVTATGVTHLRLLIDTGNNNSLLDLGKAKELGLKIDALNGPDGKPYPGYFLASLKDVKLGDAALGDLKFLVADIQPYLEKGTMPKADGTIAYTAFSDRILKMDYKSNMIGVSDKLEADIPCPGSCGDLTTPTFGHKGPPILVTTGFSVNGKPTSMQIDTMYAGTMLVFPTSVEKLGLGAEAASTHKRYFPFTDVGVDMLEATAASESFETTPLLKQAKLYFATEKVHTPDGMFDGTVGQELFAGHAVMMDFHAHHFWIV
jgi:Aspartyl protease